MSLQFKIRLRFGQRLGENLVMCFCAFPPPVKWKDHLCRPTLSLSAAAPAFPAAVSSQRWTGKIQQKRESDNKAVIRVQLPTRTDYDSFLIEPLF